VSDTDQTLIGKYLGVLLQKCSYLTQKNDSRQKRNTYVPELVGRFQELVEKNFRQMHAVQQYAHELSVTPII
jgi:AraC family transcriptional activator of pobA